MSARKLLLSWSSGKDSAWALHRLRANPRYEVAGLLTTLNESAGRVAMHAVRRSLLEAQAAAAGLPLKAVNLPWPCSNERYEALMETAVAEAEAEGFEAVAFGDLFLEDVRRYRETMLAPTALSPVFPLWQEDTTALAQAMIAGGLRAFITCVDPKQLDPSFAGRAFDADFLADLPPGVDPCGENGEFHSFVWDGPMFDRPVPVVPGEIVERDGFVFADLKPA
ncbi:MAG: ATP-binding protein [Rhodospirillaceae bacterium]|nr:ATP-binding protein [Rhodospirillaceae bacterium]